MLTAHTHTHTDEAYLQLRFTKKTCMFDTNREVSLKEILGLCSFI